MPPSSAWSQLHSSMTFDALRCVSGCCVNSNRGSGGRCAGGPMYAQITPPSSTVGYAAVLTLCLKSYSSGSLGISTQAPFTSNFQPWYTHRMPFSSLRPR